MSTYFDILPIDLLNQICYNLTYTETIILREEFNFDLNYQSFLSLKFPAFYKIVGILKNKTIRYKKYSYEESYELMYLLLDYIEDYPGYDKSVIGKYFSLVDYKNFQSNVYTDNIEMFSKIIYDYDIWIKNLKDILVSYTMLNESNSPGAIYVIYRNYFPNLNDMDDIFLWACDETDFYIDNNNSILLVKDLNNAVTEDHTSMLLSVLYILLLHDRNKIQEWKFLIKDININIIEKSKTTILLYKYILKYINVK